MFVSVILFYSLTTTEKSVSAIEINAVLTEQQNTRNQVLGLILPERA